MLLLMTGAHSCTSLDLWICQHKDLRSIKFEAKILEISKKWLQNDSSGFLKKGSSYFERRKYFLNYFQGA